jgi:hypothetical protein
MTSSRPPPKLIAMIHCELLGATLLINHFNYMVNGTKISGTSPIRHASPFLGSEILTHSECVRKPPLWVRLVDPRCGTAVSCPTSFMTPNLPKKWWYVMICHIFIWKRTVIFDQANLEFLEIFIESSSMFLRCSYQQHLSSPTGAAAA